MTYHTVFFLREILELKEKQKPSGWGDRGKGKEMKGFFAVKQAPIPPAAQVLVLEAKLLSLMFVVSYGKL